jgi:deoxyadenosine/deoxycytidine kinase
MNVFVEGNIGCGKSSLLEYLEKFEDILVLHEDISKWTNFHVKCSQQDET